MAYGIMFSVAPKRLKRGLRNIRPRITSIILTIIVNKNGKLDKWPQGFFDQNRKNISKLAGI